MKLLIYSDLHISKTSSILPNIDGKYTYRQKMIIETGEYLAKLVEGEKPDLIINLGDTFDQHTITSYDINTASAFFKCFEKFANIPHIVLVGNHEMINSDFNAIALLNNIPNITVVDEATTMGDLAFMPYCNYKDILVFPQGKYLFSHLDIQGASVRGSYVLEEGVAPAKLKEEYKYVFNGHIHKSSIIENIINVGSVTTHSFADDNTAVPQCYIFDTETNNLKMYKPDICPLFRKFEVNSNTEELTSYINKLDRDYEYIINVICPFDEKEKVKEVLIEEPLVINYRITTKTVEGKVDNKKESTGLDVNPTMDIKKSFKEFVQTVDLKYPLKYYEKVLEEI